MSVLQNKLTSTKILSTRMILSSNTWQLNNNFFLHTSVILGRLLSNHFRIWTLIISIQFPNSVSILWEGTSPCSLYSLGMGKRRAVPCYPALVFKPRQKHCIMYIVEFYSSQRLDIALKYEGLNFKIFVCLFFGGWRRTDMMYP